MNRQEAEKRLESLGTLIAGLRKEVSDTNRAVRHLKLERKSQFQQIKTLLENRLPTNGNELLYFDAGRFVWKNKNLLESASTYAVVAGEVFPSWETDFKRLPKLQRQKLFAKIGGS
jgi:uncharacterized coiled-coil DUF342 family protein